MSPKYVTSCTTLLYKVLYTGKQWAFSYVLFEFTFLNITCHLHLFANFSRVALGPLLFAVFINDFPSHISLALVLLFADDSKCLKNPSDIISLQTLSTKLSTGAI